MDFTNQCQNVAWTILTELERNILILTINNGFNHAQVQEALKITASKYFSTKARAETLFQMFLDFFENPNKNRDCHIFPENSKAHINFQHFIESLIYNRYKIKEATNYLELEDLVRYNKAPGKFMNTYMERNLDIISNSKQDEDSLKLIQEYDRWNNFRILPKKYQLESARYFHKMKSEKNKMVRVRKLNRDDLSAVLDLYQASSRRKKDVEYIVIFDNSTDDGYYTVPITVSDPDCSIFLSKKGVYHFKDPEIADLYGFNITRYLDKAKKTNTKNFWSQFRNVIKSATNFNQVKDSPDLYNNLTYDFYSKPRKKADKEKKTGGVKRSNEEQLWL